MGPNSLTQPNPTQTNTNPTQPNPTQLIDNLS